MATRGPEQQPSLEPEPGIKDRVIMTPEQIANNEAEVNKSNYEDELKKARQELDKKMGENLTDLSTDDYRSKLRNNELPDQKPGIELPVSYGNEEGREELNQTRRGEIGRQREDEKVLDIKAKKAKGEDLSSLEAGTLRADRIIKGEEAPKSFEEPVILKGKEEPKKETVLETPKEDVKQDATPGVEVVSGFGKRTEDESQFFQNATRQMGEKADVREKIGEGDLPSSVELSRLTESERGEKEHREEIVVRTPEQMQMDTENNLIEVTKNLSEARATNNRETEKTLLGQAMEAYEQVKGEKLVEKAKELAVSQLKAEKYKLITKNEFFSPERLNSATEKARQREWTLAIKSRWEELNDKEKAKYVGQDGNPNLQQLAVDLEAKRQDLATKGIEMSRDSYYQMMKEGLRPDQIKVRGFFGKLFMGSEIVIPSSKEKSSQLSKKELTQNIQDSEKRFGTFVRDSAQADLEKRFTDGQRRYTERKKTCAVDLLQQTSREIEEKRKASEVVKEQKPAKKETKKPSLEIISRIGKERTPELMKELERIRKEVESDIKKKTETKKKLQGIMAKQKRKELLTAKEVAYLRAYAEQESAA